MRDMYVPVGFRFNPSEEEVIRGFLYPKVTGLPLPWDGVRDRCVYGAEPWNVFFDADRDDMESSHCWQTKKEGGSVKKTIYVFTSITKSSPNAKDSKRAARIAGCGTWSGQTGPKDITHSDTGEIIGYSRMLTFKIKKDSANKFNDQDSLLGHWIMHEYTLSDSTLRMAGLTHNDIVLCKITRIIKNQNKNKKRSPDQIFHQTAVAAEDVLQYYSPENNINTNTAGEGESYCSAAEGDDHANNNKRSRVGEEEEIHQTAIPAEEVQYYYSENNTVQIHQMEAPPEEEVHYYSPGNNTVQIHQTAVPAEVVQFYYPENNTIQIHQTAAAPTEEVQCYFPENNTDEIEKNIYDLPYVDFGDLWQECQ